jgi:CBS domain-containing protein
MFALRVKNCVTRHRQAATFISLRWDSGPNHFGTSPWCSTPFVDTARACAALSTRIFNEKRSDTMSARTIRNVLEGQGMVTVQTTMNVTQVAALMKSHGLGAILVLENGQLMGIFTERDALFRVAAAGLDSNTTSVGEVMTANPVTIGPDKPFADALNIMHEGRFRHVPVVENGVPIGMVSSRDAMGPELEQFMYTKILEEQARDVLA